MKNSINFRSITLMALLGAALAAPVLAQPGPGAGGGMRGGPCAQNAGPGAGGGPRAMQFGQDNTRGWMLMTPEERAAHREKMLSVKTYDECKALQAEHRGVMEARAKEKGVTLPTPRQNGCDRMKARGIIN